MNSFFQRMKSMLLMKNRTMLMATKNYWKIAYEQRSTLFGDPVIANAILDQILHQSHIVSIVGPSYRIKDVMDSFENSIMRSKLVEIKRSILVNFILTLSIGIYLGFKREFSKLIGFLVIALVAVGLVFNATVVKDVLLNLFNKIMGA